MTTQGLQAGAPFTEAPPVAATASRFHSLKHAHIRALGVSNIRKRPLMTLGFGSAVVTVLWLAHFPTERLVALTALYGLSISLQLVGVVALRTQTITDNSLFFSHLMMMTLQTCAFALTGGLDSPLVSGILGPFIGTLLTYGRNTKSLVTALYLTSLMGVLALLPASLTAVVPAYPYSGALTLIALLFSVYMLYVGVTSLTDAYGQAGEKIERMREQVLLNATQRACSLEAIGSKVAHELKNPLSAVKGLVQLLERNTDDTRSRERLHVIGEEVMRMEVILRDYLSFSRPLEDLRHERVDIGEIVDDVLAVLEARAEQAHVKLEHRGTGATLQADPRRLKEAFLNLISNAIEATPSGGTVAVDVNERGSVAEVTIQDSGRGIPKELISKVGTPFFTTREGGTGLGVVLARTVVQHHGGDFSLESEVGRGTTVTLKLPFHSPASISLPYVKAADSR